MLQDEVVARYLPDVDENDTVEAPFFYDVSYLHELMCTSGGVDAEI